jgi:7,8-dihydropterin-6-yl-methyl-4-(beta-D-ribofuranosyl)aminobenzene 5'-phosphate synthase
MEAIALRPVDAITVTTLVDNVTDSLLADQGPAVRAAVADAPRVPVRLFLGGDVDDALRAEHGFAALVTVTDGARDTRVLFDAGRTPDGLVENMRRLALDPADIDVIVLSHGHWDHVTGMDGLVERLGRANVPVVIHPEFWSRRRIALPGREPFELPRRAPRRCEGRASRSWRDGGRRSCWTGPCSSPARSTAGRRSRPGSPGTRRTAPAAGSPTG